MDICKTDLLLKTLQGHDGDSVNFDLRKMQNLEALEKSLELKEIYSHPQWHEFLSVVNRANNTPPGTFTKQEIDLQMRDWALNHPQISQLLAWFHQCTAKYDLSYDPFTELPVSQYSQNDLGVSVDDAKPSSTKHSTSTEDISLQAAGEYQTPEGLQLIPDKDSKEQTSWLYYQQNQQFLLQQHALALAQQQGQDATQAYYFYQHQQHQMQLQQFQQQYQPGYTYNYDYQGETCYYHH